MDIIDLLGRKKELFTDDVRIHEKIISEEIGGSSFLVIGGGGSIGQAVVKEIFVREPKVLHVVDINENNLVELVRDIRSSLGYIKGDFKTLPIDCGSLEFEKFINAHGKYDYTVNLSAIKHVRSEKDPYSLMRMIDVNILNVDNSLRQAASYQGKKYFSCSTDKASTPVNMMGATKRVMEMFLMKGSESISVSTARFANVAFSDGSLLYGFVQRMNKNQPISAPNDVKRHFITNEEAGKICLMSSILGKNREIFFPKVTENLKPTSFTDIAIKFLEANGYEPYICESEEEARDKAGELVQRKKWPCFFFSSDTTGEKLFEEFYIEGENIEWDRFVDIGVIKSELIFDDLKLSFFKESIGKLKKDNVWNKKDIVDLFTKIIPEFQHDEKFKYLDQRM